MSHVNPVLFVLPLVAALGVGCSGSSSPGDSSSSSSSEPIAEECTGTEALIISEASDDGSHDESYGPANATDGSFASDSRWSSEGDDKTLLLDLGTEATIAEVKTAWFNADERTAFYGVEASTDNNNWSTLVSNGQSEGAEGFVTDSFDRMDARYVHRAR